MLKGLCQRHSLSSIDADYAGDGADDDLVDVVFSQQSLPLFQDEADKIDGFGDLLVVNFHGLAQFLRAFVCVLLDAFEYGLSLVGVASLREQLIASLVVPDLLDQYAFLEVIKVDFDVFRHFCVDAEPVYRYLALDYADPEDLAVQFV